MRQKVGVWIAMTIGILVAVSPLIPRINLLWGASIDPVEVLSVNFALLSFSLPLVLVTELRGHREAIEHLRGDGTEVRWEKAHEFYPHFLQALRDARDFVDIAYFATYPPSETADSARNKYYQDLPSIMKKSSGVMFRRLVRDSDRNRDWVQKILSEMNGARNFELAVLDDDQTKDHSLALSVQVVDGTSAWLVAVTSHEPRGGPRDIFLRGPAIAMGLRGYYERLWGRAKVLMKAGNLTPAGQQYLKKRV